MTQHSPGRSVCVDDGAAPGSIAFIERHFGRTAEFGPRLLGWLIDAIVPLLAMVVMVLGVVTLFHGVGPEVWNPETLRQEYPELNRDKVVLGVVVAVLAVLFALLFILWNRVWRQGRTGQSIGKQLLGLTLINASTGQPPGPMNALGRVAVNGMFFQLLFVGHLMALWDAERRTVGDVLIGTVTIDTRG